MKLVTFLGILALASGLQAREITLQVSDLLAKSTNLYANGDGSITIQNPQINFQGGVANVGPSYESLLGLCHLLGFKKVVSDKSVSDFSSRARIYLTYDGKIDIIEVSRLIVTQEDLSVPIAKLVVCSMED